MTVFVDDMFKYPMGQFRGMKMSHMIADTEEELHAMARTIGMRREWFQGDHYDVGIQMRERAIKNGAVPITLRQLSAMHAVRHKLGVLVSPDNAEAINALLREL